jgi:hypothetical protein
MYSISIGLSGYLQVIKKSIPPVKILNILGVTFFLPWIIVQVIDVIIITTTGWVESIVIPVHTLVLVWEGWAATEIISGMCNLKSSEKVLSIAVIMVVWILICAVLWR